MEFVVDCQEFGSSFVTINKYLHKVFARFVDFDYPWF